MNETDQNLKRLQNINLELLKLFVSICKKNHLRYFAMGGTLLGAVRHHGFIPWDDDVDVGMPRPDYERFVRIADRELQPPFRLRTIATNEKYRTYMVHIENTSVAIEREYYTKDGTEMRRLYAWIDILPIDGAPGERKKFYRHITLIKRVRQLLTLSLMDRNMGTSKQRSSREQKLIRFCLKTGVYRLLNPDRMYRLYRKICLKYPYDSSPLVGDTMAVYGKKENGRKEFVRRQVFGTPVMLQFEDMKLACPQQYDTYLRRIYGDYMKIPPAEERMTHEISLIEN